MSLREILDATKRGFLSVDEAAAELKRRGYRDGGPFHLLPQVPSFKVLGEAKPDSKTCPHGVKRGLGPSGEIVGCLSCDRAKGARQ